MRFTTRHAHAGTADEGFTLVEVVVALALAVGVLLALLSSSVFAIRATLDGRQNQQAGDYLSQAIEAARSLDYGSLSMRSSDLGTDANIVTVSGVKKYNPGTGLETIDANATGAITPHVVTGSTTNGTYTTKRYVTVPSTATLNAQGMPSVRRLSVEVTWTQHGRTHTRKSSTILTLTRRGLPLPNFTWAYNGPATRVAGVPTWGKNPGNDVDYGFILNNLGARDSWLDGKRAGSDSQ
jgi:type II secretory pathway pseudopilin PulG